MIPISRHGKTAFLFLVRRRNEHGLLSSSSSSWIRSASSTTTTTTTNANSSANTTNSKSTSFATATNNKKRKKSTSPLVIDARDQRRHHLRRPSTTAGRDHHQQQQQNRQDSRKLDGPVLSNQPVVLTPGQLLGTSRSSSSPSSSSSLLSLEKDNNNNNKTTPTKDDGDNDVLPKWGKHRSVASQNLITLPTLHAAALLDPKSYCRQPNTNISGTRAAQSLIQGRKTLLRTMQQQLFFNKNEPEVSTSSFHNSKSHHHHRHVPPQRSKQAYILQGHGIPTQLLQHVLDMANILLRQQHVHGFGTAASPTCEVSFQNFHGQLDFEWIRVRSRSGTNHALPWSHMLHQLGEKVSTLDMELYLTMMNRLACHLSLCLTPPFMEDQQSYQVDRFCSRLDEDDFMTSTTTTIPSRPNHWSVNMGRVWHYPPPLLTRTTTTTTSKTKRKKTNASLEPVLIVEWTPREGLAAPGHVCIRLQGYPTTTTTTNMDTTTVPTTTMKRKRRPKRLPVSMVFDSCFRYP